MHIVGSVQVSLAPTAAFIQNKKKTKSEEKFVALVMTG
jgi:hypothetical protein